MSPLSLDDWESNCEAPLRFLIHNRMREVLCLRGQGMSIL
jgi:hypothetical protein